ncbi:energy transducer TonB [Bacteroidales bacterium OttesenSCG-928-B11]|nr:energy transducer TonB [Bacteroidales bacterium OttesenSCG-928-E04]MDL2308487.1 energy transducer TonB [Bacteroidales bacterium OttesenSCG-928-C03]MDL2311428.1 energy transducer TonB [Bacteroidales bacterium OttesenSCG-928-B11]
MLQKKSTKGDLESRRSTFLALGIVLIVGLVYFGFELFATQDRAPGFVPTELDIPDMMSEEVIATDPRPPAPPAPAPKDFVLKIIDTDIETNIDYGDIFIEFNPDDKVPEILPTEFIPEIPTDDPPYEFVDEKPLFPGGEGALLKFLVDNLQYPAIAADLGISGTILVEFIVEKNGKPSNPKVIMSTAAIFEPEAIRIINIMPSWTPGKVNGQKVRSIYHLPIKFEITK